MYSAMGHAIGADLMERYEFDSDGDRLIGNLHFPQGDAYGVATLTGPLTSVKEQATGAWGSALAQRGFVSLSFDHRYFGESGGRPRQLENPAAKIADIQAAAASLHSDQRFASKLMFAVGICAGGGYMARAVAAEPLFRAFAGVAGYYAQATEQSLNTAAPAIARAREAEKRWRETGVDERVPAVAAGNGDVAMPLAEAFAYYGTPRGAVPNYINGFAVQSWAYTSTFDAIGAAKLIRVPTIVIHSERALAPSLARRFQADLNDARILWIESSGQIDFYDDPRPIAIGADAVTRFFKAATR
jgi:fermentation-respiration switch protein FrsA (DUF1100 family)